MFTTIIMHRQNGYSIACHPKYDPALDSCVDATRANSETTAVIYNSEGQLIWRIFGKLEAPAPVATPEKLHYVVSDFAGATVFVRNDALNMAIDNAHALADSRGEVCTVWMNGSETRQVYATTGRFPLNERGMYYSRTGMLCNADGTRSIFDDVDTAGSAE